MFSTVSMGKLRQDRSNEKEQIDLPNALRAAANMTSRVRATLSTAATGVFTTIWTSADMPEGAAWAIDYHIVARATAGGVGPNRYDQAALFYRQVAGVATQQGATGTISPAIEAIAGATARFAVSGNAILVQVQDDGVASMDWDAYIEAREVT